MVDELKSIRDNLFKVISGLGSSEREIEDDDEDGGRAPLLDARAARALIQAVFARAGKGKDEVVQIVAREIGMAVAAMLKEPLSQLAKRQKLQISFEFVPKDPKARRKSEAEAADEPEPEPEEEAEEHAEAEEEEADEAPRAARPRRAPRARSASTRHRGSKSED